MNRVRTIAIVLLLGTAGCTAYVPVDLADVAPQETVRLELETQELARVIQFADVSSGTVKGRYIDGSADSISVVVQTPASYTQISLPRSSILSSARREVDNRKSFAVSAIIVGGVAALAAAGFEGGGGGPAGDGGGIDEARIPLFGFSLPFSLPFGLIGGS